MLLVWFLETMRIKGLTSLVCDKTCKKLSTTSIVPQKLIRSTTPPPSMKASSLWLKYYVAPLHEGTKDVLGVMESWSLPSSLHLAHSLPSPQTWWFPYSLTPHSSLTYSSFLTHRSPLTPHPYILHQTPSPHPPYTPIECTQSTIVFASHHL